VATAARRTACLHVSRALQAARRRAAFDFPSRLGRRAEAGPRQVLRRVRPHDTAHVISYNGSMRILLPLGAIVLLLGLLSLFVPIPRRERHGFDFGGISIGLETTAREKVHPAVSAVLIGGGVALILVSRRHRR